jgi:hypothetical protein
VGGAQSSSREEEDSEDEDGVAQFESDEGEDMEDSEEDEEVSFSRLELVGSRLMGYDRLRWGNVSSL